MLITPWGACDVALRRLETARSWIPEVHLNGCAMVELKSIGFGRSRVGPPSRELPLANILANSTTPFEKAA